MWLGSIRLNRLYSSHQIKILGALMTKIESMKRQNTVLIIEDSRTFAQSLTGIIKEYYDHEIIVAEKFSRAVELLEERSEDIFVVITDLNLPDAEDGATIRLVKAHDIPCIVFTGSFSNSLREDVLDLGVSDYVLKQGVQDLVYVARMVHRIYQNPTIDILVVDDSRSARVMIKELLSRQCYKVTAVSSGKEALEAFEKNPNFKIVILDLVMDEMDGLELLKRLRNQYDSTELAIIGISAVSSHLQVAKFMKYGANDFLYKPFEAEEFFCRVNMNAEMLEQFENQRILSKQKDELMGIAAHDIRGPIGSIKVGLSMIGKRVDDAKTKRFIDMAQESASDVMELLDSLLDMSAIESSVIKINPEELDLCALVALVIGQYKLWAEEKSQSITLDIQDEPVIVCVDKIRIKEVIVNLLSNAIKYSPISANITIKLSSETGAAILSIEDQGEGISEGEQNKLFEPFAKLSTQPTGGESSVGLGLAICKKIVDLHKAKIAYCLSPEHGSIFEIRFKLVSQKVET